MIKSCILEINLNGSWQACGEIRLLGDENSGVAAATSFEYLQEYLDQNEKHWDGIAIHAASLLYPLSFNSFRLSTWPAFLLDIIPSGAARRAWEARLKLTYTPRSDWTLLVEGAGNPPGNLRIRTKELDTKVSSHPGFKKSDIVKRHQNFIEHAYRAGSPVSGSSGAGGDAPKYMLREATNGSWHADGVLSDANTKNFWIVKFPRGNRSTTDCMILRAEESYYKVAEAFGLNVFGPLRWIDNCLFIPRFDRLSKKNKVIYLGFESLYSAAGVAQFGAHMEHEVLVETIHKFSSNPEKDVIEYFMRDILNVALGNTDSHARNTAFVKYPDGKTTLSPLFDFAPMFLDPAGIVRACRWKYEEGMGFPVWEKVADDLISNNFVPKNFKNNFKNYANLTKKLPSLMKKYKTPVKVIAACLERIQNVERMLR